jgi:hypothetical protein
LAFHGSVRHAENGGCFVRTQTIQIAQLEYPAQRRREFSQKIFEARMKLGASALVLRILPAIGQLFYRRVFLLLADGLIERYVNVAWPPAQLHARRIADNRA